MSIWDRFDTIATPTEVAYAQRQHEPVVAGDYKVILESLEPAENKDGLPMIKGKFTAIEGGKFLFYNHNLQNLNYPQMTAGSIAEAVAFVSALAKREIEYTGMAQFADDIKSIPMGGIYTINVSYPLKKDKTPSTYPKYKIVSCEDIGDLEDVGDLPFVL